MKHFQISLNPQCASHRGVKLHGLLPTEESSFEVCITPQNQVHQISQKTLRCTSYCGVKLSGVHLTTVSSYMVCIAPQSQAPRCASHRRVKLHTEESKSKISLVSGCFKRDNQEKSFYG